MYGLWNKPQWDGIKNNCTQWRAYCSKPRFSTPSLAKLWRGIFTQPYSPKRESQKSSLYIPCFPSTPVHHDGSCSRTLHTVCLWVEKPVLDQFYTSVCMWTIDVSNPSGIFQTRLETSTCLWFHHQLLHYRLITSFELLFIDWWVSWCVSDIRLFFVFVLFFLLYLRKA